MSLSLPEPYVGLDTFNERSVKEHADQVQRNFEKIRAQWVDAPKARYSIIATSEARTSASYGTMTTPDVVTGVRMPANGLMFVAFQGIWKGNAAARAAIFIGANQLRVALGDSNPVVQEASHPGGATPRFNNLATMGNGLQSSGGTAVDVGSAVTTGQLVGLSSTSPFGGAVVVFAAAGTYDVSVQFKGDGVSATTVKERYLWVWTLAGRV